MNAFKYLLKQTVERLFLVVWPPEGEENFSDVDLSIGFVFASNPARLCVVTTDLNDLWSPCIRDEDLPTRVFAWSSFYERIEKWMNVSQTDDLDTEYYEVTDVDIFENIVSHTIQSIELIGLQNEDEPFGVKLVFENDTVLSFPISDGNTIATSRFNVDRTPMFFQHLGKVEYKVLDS